MTPDRHHAPAGMRHQKKNKKIIRIATWNVKTLNEETKPEKVENIKKEAARLGLGILGMCEMRWIGTGKVQLDGYTIIYSGEQKRMRGVGIMLDKDHSKALKGYWALSSRVLLVKLSAKPLDINIIQAYAPTAESSEEDLEQFYSDIETALKHCKSFENTIIQGDFNAKVGKGFPNGNLGNFGLGERNERGDKLVEWAMANNFIIGNTIFQQPRRRLWTWKSPSGHKNQIDYILIKKRFQNALLSCKTYPGADCNSDHVPVVGRLRLKLRKLKSKSQNTKLDLALLKADPIVKEKYAVEVKNRFELLEHRDDTEEQWENLKECITSAANETIPTLKRKRKQKWMTDEILCLLDKRRESLRDSEQYKTIQAEITTKCCEAKEQWLNNMCDQVEHLFSQDTKSMHAKIKEISGRKNACSSSGCIRAKDGTIVIEKDKILERWAEYIKDLYEDENRHEDFNVRNNFEGPPISRDEVRHAIRKIKSGKAAGPDNIAIELIEALEEFGIVKLTTFLGNIYETGKIPGELLKSVFIALPKKPGAIECELHRTISLMSHITKILLRIIMLRARNRVKPEIGAEQCGFVEGKGTTNAIYILRAIIERSLEVGQDLYFCFIDYTKAFDTVKHEEIMNMLQDINVDGKDLRIIRNLYWQQTAAIRIESEISEYQKIKRGVRQGCVLSPDLFSLYSEVIMRKIENMPGVAIGGHNINNLRYADDTVLIATSERNLQALVDTINEESEKLGLGLNKKKTETMVISKKKEIPRCKIQLNGTTLKQVENFKYLGVWITSDGRCATEIRSRIAQAKSAFQNMKNILTNQKLAIKTRCRVLGSYILPILMYGCEAWNISQKLESNIKAAEMWFLRRMLKVSYKDRVTNQHVLERVGTEQTLLKDIRKRQSKFFGHVMRRKGLEHLVTTGMVNGRRGRGRPREKMIDRLSLWLKVEKPTLVMRHTCNREGWRSLVADAYRHGT